MYVLFIGNKNYSSWSLRGWLAARLSGAPFREVKIQLQGTYNPDNRSFSPTALVPALHHGDVQVWDSLAISEYLAERHRGMWPENPATRAWARSIVCEMHSGFGALRNEMAAVRTETLSTVDARVNASNTVLRRELSTEMTSLKGSLKPDVFRPVILNPGPGGVVLNR